MCNIPKSIFHESWWVEIVSNGQWGEVSYDSKFGKVKFCYATRVRGRFFREIYTPPLTPYSGIYFELNQPIDQTTKFKLLAEAVPELVGQLPKYFRLKINCLPQFDWWSPLYWQGFGQHTRYTSILQDIGDHETIWQGFSSTLKRNIKKAEKQLQIEFASNAELLYGLFKATLENQGRSPGYPFQTLRRVFDELVRRGQGRILIARDQAGRPHAGLLLVWDTHTAYYLVGGSDPSLRQSGAMPLVMWTAIREASTKVGTFDFEGSMQKGIDRFVRSFGALPVPYSNISDGFMASKIVRQSTKIGK